MGTITLTWNDTNTTETGHKVYRSLSPMTVGSLPVAIATLGANITSYTDSDVVEGQTYYYRVAAVRNTSEAVSSEIIVQAVAANLLVAPSGLVLELVADVPDNKVRELRGSSNMTNVVNVYGDDTNVKVPNCPFPIIFAGTNIAENIYVGSNSFVTFGGGSDVNSGYSAIYPGFDKITVGAADRAYLSVFTGVSVDGDAYTIRYEGLNAYQNTTATPERIWELTFYVDGTIILVTGTVMGGVAGDSALYKAVAGGLMLTIPLADNTAFTFTPTDGTGSSWVMETQQTA